MFSDRLIVSDLDGTFLGAREAVVPRNIEAIRDFQSKGGRFTFATGRTHEKLCELVPGLCELVNAPLILLNGTLLYDGAEGKTIFEFRLPIAPILPKLASLLAQFPTVYIRFLRDNMAYECRSVDALKYLVTLDFCHKIVIVGEPDELAVIQDQLRQTHSDVLHTCKSCAHLLELLPAGASKGVLLDQMRQMLSGDRLVRVYGIGDFENDLELLAHADVAACPQNAIDAVKKVAARVLCHHTEGAIADLIETIYHET